MQLAKEDAEVVAEKGTPFEYLDEKDANEAIANEVAAGLQKFAALCNYLNWVSVGALIEKAYKELDQKRGAIAAPLVQ